MSGKIKLGKTKDSRTRGKLKLPESEESVFLLKKELKGQEAFVDYLLKKGYSIKTIKSYVQQAKSFILWIERENIPEDLVNYNDILFFIQGIKKKVVQRTVSGYINGIKHYFAFLHSIGKIMENPVIPSKIRGIKRKILYDILSIKELDQIYNDFKIPSENDPNINQNWFRTSSLTRQRNKVIVGLMVYQGLNTTELGCLTVKDLKLKEGRIYIAGSRRSNERELKIEAHQVLDMMEYQLNIRPELLRQTDKNSDKLFISAGSSNFFTNIMSKLIIELHHQNGKITSIKQIRASVITHWLKLYNLRQVQYLAGHRFVSSTEAYKINDLDDLQDGINKYHPI